MSESGSSSKSDVRQPLTLPLIVPMALAAGVWIAGWTVPPLGFGPPPRAYIRTGTAMELAPAIRAAPRAMVYVGCIWSTYSLPGKRRFEATAQRLASEHPEAGIQFFVIENESDEDAMEWARSFPDEQLAMFGHLGWGWVLWFENGQLRDVDPYTGYPGPCRPTPLPFERTLALWR